MAHIPSNDGAFDRITALRWRTHFDKPTPGHGSQRRMTLRMYRFTFLGGMRPRRREGCHGRPFRVPLTDPLRALAIRRLVLDERHSFESMFGRSGSSPAPPSSSSRISCALVGLRDYACQD